MNSSIAPTKTWGLWVKPLGKPFDCHAAGDGSEMVGMDPMDAMDPLQWESAGVVNWRKISENVFFQLCGANNRPDNWNLVEFVFSIFVDPSWNQHLVMWWKNIAITLFEPCISPWIVPATCWNWYFVMCMSWVMTSYIEFCIVPQQVTICLPHEWRLA